MKKFRKGIRSVVDKVRLMKKMKVIRANNSIQIKNDKQVQVKGVKSVVINNFFELHRQTNPIRMRERSL